MQSISRWLKRSGGQPCIFLLQRPKCMSAYDPKRTSLVLDPGLAPDVEDL